MSDADIERLLDSDWSYFSDRQMQFDSFVRETVRVCGPGILSLSRTIAEQILTSASSELQINVEVVLDTSMLFREIFNSVRGKPGFMSDFIDSSFFEMYGPPELVKEIHEKIDQRMRDDSERKAAHLLADKWLTRVRIANYQEPTYRKRMLATLRERDRKDVPFLALALTLRTHAVLTGDSDFDSQSEVFTLKLRDAREIWYEFSKGSISVCALGASVAVVELLFRALAVAMNYLVQMIGGLVGVVSAFAHAAWEGLSRVPMWAWYGLLAVLVATIVAYFVSPQVSSWVDGTADKARAWVDGQVSKAKTVLTRFVENVMGIAQVIAPYVGDLVIVYGHLGYCSLVMIGKIRSLERRRPPI